MLCVEFWTCEQLYTCILGLGSRLCETMRDEYPMNHLMSCTVTPCATGESPLQGFPIYKYILPL
jgi:hypothetical protein